MKKALIFVLLTLVVLLGIGLLWLSSVDGKYEVKQSIEIKESTQKTFEVISNFHTWSEWSPWLCIDRESESTVIGNGNQRGDKLIWNGQLIGAGEIEHISVENKGRILQMVRFIEPIQSKSEISFDIQATTEGTLVTWEMKGEMPFFYRMIAKQMETYIGEDFKRGLKMLKDYTEEGVVHSKVVIKGVEEFNGFSYVGKEVACAKDMIEPSMQTTLYDVGNWLVASSVLPEEAFSIYSSYPADEDSCTYVSGFRLKDASRQFPYEGANVDSIRSCKVVKVIFYGHYRHLGNAWTAAMTYQQHQKLSLSTEQPPFEVYLNDPVFFPNPSDWVTEVYLPVE